MLLRTLSSTCSSSNTLFSNIVKVFNRVMSNDAVLRDIFIKSVQSVQPEYLIQNEVNVHQRTLTVRGESYNLKRACYVVGFGKAVYGMASELERILGSNLQRGVVNVPVGIFEKYERAIGSKIEYVEGAKNNLPDEMALKGAEMIKELAEKLNEDDLLIVLVSGGGSALLPLPVPPITLKQKQNLVKDLAKRGADINELNCVRKKISIVKGGGLAELAYPCRIICFVLSDIIGDPLDFIASGPTMPNTDPSEMAATILKKYRLDGEIPTSIKSVIETTEKRDEKRCPVTNGEYEHVKTYVIGNNKIAAEAAKHEAINKGFQSAIISTQIEGDVGQISKIYAEFARNIASVISDLGNKDNLQVFLRTFSKGLRAEEGFIQEVLDMDYTKGVCFVFAGEPTVVVKGTGKGGRNQQLALAFSMEVNKLDIKGADISFLSCGTDGIDGPTDAAGAIAISDFMKHTQNINPELYLENNDAYGFYETYNGGQNLVKIGHTGTNVMDIHLMIIEPKI
uniref:Glycerate kinase n=1 Tax=Diabrotica virgifera virgifera TaxID=50390 RepID=A0A6P7F6A7_DIAVI